MYKSKEKIKAEKALEIAKAMNRPELRIPNGISGTVMSNDYQLKPARNGVKKKVDHEAVLKMLNKGSLLKEVATKFGITKQAVSYIKNKPKPEC